MNVDPGAPVDSRTSALQSAHRMAMMLGGFRLPRAIYTIAVLGVADLLSQGPMTCDDIAVACSVNRRSLYRVMRALSSIGVFTEDEGERFALSPLGSTLRSDATDSARFAAVALGDAQQWQLWNGLYFSVRTGKPAWNNLFGIDFTDACIAERDLGRRVNLSKTVVYAASDESILQAYDFSSCHCIVDVGLNNGYGALLAKILQRYQAVTGVLYDLPTVVADAAARIRALDLSERCRLVAGDCRQSVAVRTDTYLLRGLLHNLGDDTAVRILQNCRDVISEGGKVIVCEMIMPSGNEFFVGKLIDLETLLLTSDGRERTEAELRNIILAAGYRVARVTATRAPMSVIEAVKA